MYQADIIHNVRRLQELFAMKLKKMHDVVIIKCLDNYCVGGYVLLSLLLFWRSMWNK